MIPSYSSSLFAFIQNQTNSVESKKSLFFSNTSILINYEHCKECWKFHFSYLLTIKVDKNIISYKLLFSYSHKPLTFAHFKQNMSVEILATRLSKISESQTLAMARKSRELQALGKDIISLSIGEPDYDTPDFIKEAAKLAIDQNYTHYTPVAGFQDLRVAISAKFKRDNSINYAPEQIVVSTGAKQSIANVILSLIDLND